MLNEAGRGDPDLARRRLPALAALPVLPTTPAVEALASKYMSEGLVPVSEPLDALHLSSASVHGIEYLLTWNCRHLAAASVRRRLTAINERAGHPVPIVCTPEELMEF